MAMSCVGAGLEATPLSRSRATWTMIVSRRGWSDLSLAWLGSLLNRSEPGDGDELRWRRARSNPAVQITGDMDNDRLAQRVVRSEPGLAGESAEPVRAGRWR